MPATFHQTGAADLYVRYRSLSESSPTQWRYLGTSVVCPVVDAAVYTTPVLSDYNAPIPLNEVYHGEVHEVAATLNRFEYTVYNRVRARNNSGGGGFGFLTGLQRRDDLDSLGKLTRGAEDWELLIRLNPTSASDVAANATPLGRMYYSACLSHYRETTENSRVEEVSLLFTCLPLYRVPDHRFDLFTELPADWGSVPDPE
jgi:hypothetical protein